MGIRADVGRGWTTAERITSGGGRESHITVHSGNRNPVFIGDDTRQTFEVVSGLAFTIGGGASSLFAKGTPGVFAIVDVGQGLDRFHVSGDQTAEMELGDAIRVSGSTGNDGDYVIEYLEYVVGTDRTIIGVEGDIPDATVDGDVIHPDKIDVLVEV